VLGVIPSVEVGLDLRAGRHSDQQEAAGAARRGFGSGRRGGTVTAESTASYVITASTVGRALQMERRVTGTVRFDEGRFPVEITIDTTKPSYPFIELTHHTRDDREGDRVMRDRIRLVWTVPTYGGQRWWFQCPRTWQKTTKLYLPNGGRHFWSRQAYGLGYACQREDSFSRLQRRAAMLNRQLGGEGWRTWEDPPTKPKRMRWSTYEKKYERWERVVERANAEFRLKAMRILRRPAVSGRIGRSRRP
jgi:hypothetical protein